MACHSANLFINVEDAAGRTADQVADQMIAETEAAIQGIQIDRTSLTVAGEPAVALEGLPGVDSSRNIVIVHADRLYHVVFVPWDEAREEFARLETLYGTVIDSITFLPAGSSPAPAGGSQAIEGSGVVVFVEGGDVVAWDEATGQRRTIFDGGDAIRVELSDDGQVVAFLRRSVVQRSELEWFEQSALWAVGLDGQNPRELVSAEELREVLEASERDSTNIPQMAWLPGTHRLVYSGWTYIVQAEGESHAIPAGLYMVDAETLEKTTLASAGSNLRFVPSPDGEQMALMSLTGLSFIDADGSSLREDVLTYAQVGMAGPLFPTGAWTADSRAFLITGSIEMDDTAGFNFTIWRVPVDGSSPDPLTTIRRSHPGSVSFSPDGRSVAFIQYTDQQPAEIAGWFIAPLEPDPGLLAIPAEIELGYASVHWSPAGDAFTGTMLQLCPGASQDTEVCDSPISFWGTAAAVGWIDPFHFLFLTRYPSVLFLVTLDASGMFDGTTVPIVAWPLEEFVGPNSFAAAEGSP